MNPVCLSSQGSGRYRPMMPGDSILDVLNNAGLALPYSCHEGACGTCETGVQEGIPEHRDAVLSRDEKAENDCMMIRVSRTVTPRIVLDLRHDRDRPRYRTCPATGRSSQLIPSKITPSSST